LVTNGIPGHSQRESCAPVGYASLVTGAAARARAGPPQSGLPTGSTGVSDMLLTTPAADAYQATAAVMMPTYPPIWTTPLPAALPARLPMKSRISVTSRVKKTPKTAVLIRALQNIMYVLKTAKENRIQASDGATSPVATLPNTTRATKAARPIQKPPYVPNAVAPNVLRLRNSHMPAMNWARPP